MLAAENKMLSARVDELTKTNNERSDYEQVRQELLAAQEEVLELNKENEMLVTEMEEKEIELEEATLKVETFKLEMEEAYIDDDAPPVEDHRAAYDRLKRKLKVYFEIMSEEKFGMEEKIEGLNNKLQELQAQKANVMDSLEVQQELRKRDRDIEELMQMIDSYKDSQKMIEMMTAKNDKLEQVTQQFQADLTAQKAAREALEEELRQSKDYADDLEGAVKDLEEEVRLYEELQLDWEEKELNYEEVNQQLRDKIEGLELERNELETDKFQNENEKEKYVNYLQDASRQQISDAESFKDKLLMKYQARFWHFRAQLHRLKAAALPEKVQGWLRLEPMENYELLEQSDIRLDCVVEMLFREYVLNFALLDESPNLYSNARDLLLDVLNIKAYLGLCKVRFAQQGQEAPDAPDHEDQDQDEPFVKSEFYEEVMKNLPNIESLYLILTRGELSASYCMSHFAEAKFKLESLVSQMDLPAQIRTMRVLTKGVQQMAMLAAERGAGLEPATKGLLLDVIAKSLRIFHHFERVPGFSEEHVRKVETYEGSLTRRVQNQHQGRRPRTGQPRVEPTGGGAVRPAGRGQAHPGRRGEHRRLLDVARPAGGRNRAAEPPGHHAPLRALQGRPPL